MHLWSDGSWSKHINGVYEKACKRLTLLKLLKHTNDRETLIKIYIAFVRLMLKKDNIVWGNCTKGNSDLLKRVQIEAARIITGLTLLKHSCIMNYWKN